MPPIASPGAPGATRWFAALFARMAGLLGGAAAALAACWHWRYPPRLPGADFALPINQFAWAVASEPFWDGYHLGPLGTDPRTNLLLAVVVGGLFGMLVGSVFIPRRRPQPLSIAVSGPGGTTLSVPVLVPTSGLAVACLVFGVLSLVSICVLPVSAISVVLAMVFGSAARGSIRRGAATGGGMVTTGVLLASVTLVLDLVLIAIFGGIAVFNFRGLSNGVHH